MNIFIRVDSSNAIGSGHVMRCLTLAGALREKGCTCHFVCRNHPGNLSALIQEKGYRVTLLPLQEFSDEAYPQHAAWVGADWQTDAHQTAAFIATLETPPDWLVVDHYGLDRRWETSLRPAVGRIFVIDDLADRPHDCDCLLDQNLVANLDKRYKNLVPSRSHLLLGPHHALVRTEFNSQRTNSLARREIPELKNLLIFMGGSDPANDTCRAVAGARLSERQWEKIDIVVGQAYAGLDELRESLIDFPPGKLHVQTREMAQLMAGADLALTGGGSITWEKCVLGLPSLVVIQAENQRGIASAMHQRGSLHCLGFASDLTPSGYAKMLDETQLTDLQAMTESARSICDGTGVAHVVSILKSPS